MSSPPTVPVALAVISSRTAIANAIRLAARGVEHDVVGRLGTRLAASNREEQTEVV